jgi:hypothetical protein
MKRTFIDKNFSARSFRSATLAGPVKITFFQPVRTAMFVAGAVAGRHFHSGSNIGQHYHTGATAGISHG